MILDPPADPVAIINSPVSRSSAIELFPSNQNVSSQDRGPISSMAV